MAQAQKQSIQYHASTNRHKTAARDDPTEEVLPARESRFQQDEFRAQGLVEASDSSFDASDPSEDGAVNTHMTLQSEKLLNRNEIESEKKNSLR